MSWFWLTDPIEDSGITQDMAAGWETRDEAEEWMSTWYADLVAEGIHDATLTNDGEAVYTMSLDE